MSLASPADRHPHERTRVERVAATAQHTAVAPSPDRRRGVPLLRAALIWLAASLAGVVVGLVFPAGDRATAGGTAGSGGEHRPTTVTPTTAAPHAGHVGLPPEPAPTTTGPAPSTTEENRP